MRFSGILTACTLIWTAALQAQPGWTSVNSGTTEDLNSVFIPGYGDTAYVVGDNGTMLRSLDSGQTWSALTSGVSERLNDMYFWTPDSGIVVGDNGLILRSIDAGLTWATVASGVTENLYCISFDCNRPNGVIGGSSQTILRSNNRGQTWSIVQTGFLGEFIGADMASNMDGMIVGVNSIFQPLAGETTDGAVTWDFHAFYLNGNEGNANDVHAFTAQEATVVSSVFDGTGAISTTIDRGANWTTTLVSEDLVGIDFPILNTGYVVGSSGTIMKTTDHGSTWVDQVSGTGEKLREVSFSDSIRGCTVGDNGIILKTSNGGVVTSVEPIAVVTPACFELFNNYPNPFNPSTAISFSVPSGTRSRSPEANGQLSAVGFVELDVVDLLGREVATLVHERLGAGVYRTAWDAQGMPSGVYFYRLSVGGFVEVKKMMLMR